jgi:hypothetical protein
MDRKEMNSSVLLSKRLIAWSEKLNGKKFWMIWKAWGNESALKKIQAKVTRLKVIKILISLRKDGGSDMGRDIPDCL